MPKTQFSHKGKQIVIESVKDKTHLRIDGEHVQTFSARPGRFYTPHLPYQDYSSMTELAKALVKHVPRFMPKEH